MVVVESAYSAADVEPGHSANAPARVVPGSHRGSLHSLRHNDKFTGAVDDALAADCETNAVECLGPAGS